MFYWRDDIILPYIVDMYPISLWRGGNMYVCMYVIYLF